MRITLIGPVHPYRGGIAHYTGLLAQALAARHSLALISFKRQYPAFLYPGQSDRDPGPRPPGLPAAEYLLDPLYPWTWAQAVRRICAPAPDSPPPDLAVIQWWTTFWAPGLAAVAAGLRRRGVPSLFLIHNVLPHETRPWDRPLARLALRQGAGYIVQTRREAGRLEALLPEASAKPIAVQPLPAYDIFSAGRSERAAARAHLGLEEQEPVLLFFGIVRPYKGLEYLLDALATPPLKALRPRLLVAGEVWQDKAALEAQIARLELTAQIRLEDRYLPDDEAALFFSAADVFVAPYIAGTQSAAIQAARAFGLPVVASHEIAQDAAGAENFLCADPRDPAALAQAVAQALHSERPAALDGSREWGTLAQAIVALAGRIDAQ